MITILIVDDSETEIQILKNIFKNEPDMEVIGCAHNGQEALDLTERLKPNLITMDLQMPVMNGIEAIRQIMTQLPTPIIVISSKLKTTQTNMPFNALDAGALSVLEKPINIHSSTFEIARKRIVDTVRNMAEIKVIKRRFQTLKSQHKIVPHKLHAAAEKKSYEIIAIGTSVGGPQALKSILSRMPANFPIPIVIVQHMTQGFIGGFSKWLNDNTLLTVKEAEDFEDLKGGVVYLAPDNQHFEVDRVNNQLIAKLIDAPPVSGFCPSATRLLRSIAKHCGKNAIGILLTGMGSDGAQGLLELKKVHGHTIVQDPQSTVVFGMAGVAHSLGAVDRIVELDKIPEYLTTIIQTKTH